MVELSLAFALAGAWGALPRRTLLEAGTAFDEL